MEEIPLGSVPPLEAFLLKVHGPHEITLEDEDSIYLITGAINQGLDNQMTSIGAEGRWLPGHGLSITIANGRSLHALIRRLIDIELAHPNEFTPSPALLAHDILNHFGYCWPIPAPELEESDGEGEEGPSGFQEA